MTPDHEAKLHEAARDNAMLKMLLDLRHSDAFREYPMSDEDFYHVALMTMTDVANVFRKSAIDCMKRACVDTLIYKDGN
jgi:hypothetical protein